MAAKPTPGRPGRKASVNYNLEKPPLTSDRAEDGTDTLHDLARRSHWDIRHWSFPAAMLMLIVGGLGVLLILELSGVRLVSPLIDEWSP